MAYHLIDKIQMLNELGRKAQRDAGIDVAETPFDVKARELEDELAKRIDDRIQQYQDGLISSGEFVLWVIDAAMKE